MKIAELHFLCTCTGRISSTELRLCVPTDRAHCMHWSQEKLQVYRVPPTYKSKNVKRTESQTSGWNSILDEQDSTVQVGKCWYQFCLACFLSIIFLLVGTAAFQTFFLLGSWNQPANAWPSYRLHCLWRFYQMAWKRVPLVQAYIIEAFTC